MVKIAINGANGRMGKKVREICISLKEVQAVCGVDLIENLSDASFPIYSSFDKINEEVDVVIDFSSPSSLEKELEWAIKTTTPVVLCPTGFSEEQIEKIYASSKEVALFRSANMSVGVNAIISAVKEVTRKLCGFDIEIIEKHHHNKVDAPSGTALMLADAVKEVSPEKFYVYGREGITGKRDEREIGIHAVRGGSIVGEHDVIFAGENETVTISHQATDRSVFAFGAVRAAIFMKDKKNGLYNMDDVLGANV